MMAQPNGPIIARLPVSPIPWQVLEVWVVAPDFISTPRHTGLLRFSPHEVTQHSRGPWIDILVLALSCHVTLCKNLIFLNLTFPTSERKTKILFPFCLTRL